MLTNVRKGIFDELYIAQADGTLLPVSAGQVDVDQDIADAQADIVQLENDVATLQADVVGKQDLLTFTGPLTNTSNSVSLDTANLGDITTNVIDAQLINCAFEISTPGEVHCGQLRGNALANILTTVDNKILPVSDRVAELEEVVTPNFSGSHYIDTHPTSNNLFFRNNGGVNVFGIDNQTVHAYQQINVHNPIVGGGAPYTKPEVDNLLAGKKIA